MADPRRQERVLPRTRVVPGAALPLPELYANNGWQLLRRAPDRCGRARSLGTERADDGSFVEVPQASANELVYVRLHLHRSLKQRIAALALHPHNLPQIELDH